MKAKLWLGASKFCSFRHSKLAREQLAVCVGGRHFYCNCNRPGDSVSGHAVMAKTRTSPGARRGYQISVKNMPLENENQSGKALVRTCKVGSENTHHSDGREELVQKGRAFYSWGPAEFHLCKHPSSMRGLHFPDETYLLGLFRVRQQSRVPAS